MVTSGDMAIRVMVVSFDDHHNYSVMIISDVAFHGYTYEGMYGLNMRMVLSMPPVTTIFLSLSKSKAFTPLYTRNSNLSTDRRCRAGGLSLDWGVRRVWWPPVDPTPPPLWPSSRLTSVLPTVQPKVRWNFSFANVMLANRTLLHNPQISISLFLIFFSVLAECVMLRCKI